MMKRQSGRTEVILPDKNDNKKPEKDFQFWLKSAGWVWLALFVVFSCYWSSFFLGNHDFRFVRYGVPVDSGVWEGRFMQFVLPKLLVDGHILPVLNVFLGFAFLALGVVLLARWFGLAEKYREVLPFALLIVLNPYILTQLYYVHQILPILFWHLLCVLGVIWMDKAAGERRPGLAAAGVLALGAAMGGYAASLELVLTIIAGKFWLDVLRAKKNVTALLLHYIKFGMIVLAALLCYAAVIEGIKSYGLISLWMYNVQTLTFESVLDKFWGNWHRPWVILCSVFPFEKWVVGCGFSLLAVTALAVSWKCRKLLWGVLCLTVSVYLAFILAFLSPYDFFEKFRVHFFSVPYLLAVLFAVVFSCGTRGSRNTAFATAIVLICLYIGTNFYAQKIWLLGNKQDDLYVERIKHDFLPRLVPGRKYRLATLGGLYGREKFAGVNNIYFLRTYDRDQELFRFPMYFNVIFSSGFFLSEADNPIWGDAGYTGAKIFYSTAVVADDEKFEAEIFVKDFGADKDAQLWALRIMRPYPATDYCFVGEKDIFLMMPQVRYDKEVLIGNVQESMKKDKETAGN